MMKKSVLSLMVGAALLIAPMSASALTPMTVDGLKDATGQAGVDIALDMIKIESWTGATTYTDTDGGDNDWIGYVDGTGNAASITIGAKHTTKIFNAITSGTLSMAANVAIADIMGETYDLTPTDAAGGDFTPIDAPTANSVSNTPDGRFIAMPLSIDIGTCRILSAGLLNNNGLGIVPMQYASSNGFTFNTNGPSGGNALVTGVTIGLPTIEIITDTHGHTYDIAINQTGAYNDGETLIEITKGNSVMAICGGFLEIAAH